MSSSEITPVDATKTARDPILPTAPPASLAPTPEQGGFAAAAP